MKATPVIKPGSQRYAEARSHAGQQLWAVRLQVERLREGFRKPDRRFAQSRADFEFLIGALWRLRRAVLMAAKIEAMSECILAMVAEYDAVLPVLKRLRDVGEHFDSGSIDASSKELLGAVQWADAFTWLGERVDYEAAGDAADRLFGSFREAATLIGGDPSQHPLEPG